MTKTTSASLSTTLDWLVSTLTKFLGWLGVQNQHWLLRKKFAIETYKDYRKDKEWHAPDADALAERIAYNDALLVVEELVRDLAETVEKNPYPGEQKYLLTIAVELFPNAGVKFEPGRRRKLLKGRDLWERIFEIGEISSIKINFPVTDAEHEITEVERKLWELVREDGTVPAIEIPKALNMKPTGKNYAAIREKLIERGWVWKSMRKDGKISKVVVAPQR